MAVKRTGEPDEDFPELKPYQAAALKALLLGSSIKQAAIASGVSERTIYKWRKEDPVFSKLLKEHSEQIFEDASQRMTILLELIVDRVMLTFREEEPGFQESMQALNSVVRNVLALREFHDILARIEELEEAQRNGEL